MHLAEDSPVVVSSARATRNMNQVRGEIYGPTSHYSRGLFLMKNVIALRLRGDPARIRETHFSPFSGHLEALRLKTNIWSYNNRVPVANLLVS